MSKRLTFNEMYELLSKMDLSEQAFPKSKIIDRLYFRLDDIMLHLELIYIIRNRSNNLNHWVQELYNFLHKIPKCKNNKVLSEKDILKVLLGWMDTFYEDISNIEDEIRIKENIVDLPVFDVNKLYNFIVSYLKWLAHQLATVREVSLAQIGDKIAELLTDN